MAIQVRDALPVTGEDVSGVAPTGNPVQVGAPFVSAPAIRTDGVMGPLVTDSRGSLRVTVFSGNTPAGLATASVTALIGASSAGLNSVSHNYLSDGTGWRAESRPAAVSRIVSAAASTNGTTAKASAGDLHRIRGYNAAAAVRYLKIYNKASAPTVGTDTPVLTYALGPAREFDIDAGGFYFSTGIAYAMTTGSADADTGALTAADVVGLNITYT